MLSNILYKLSSSWLILILLFSGIQTLAQNSDSTGNWQGDLVVFVDLYYAYDFNDPKDKTLPYFLYSHNRHNEFNLNYGLLGWQTETSKYTAALILQIGTFAIANYASEPSILKNIYQASAGFNVYKKLWIEAGIFPAHLGLETAKSTQNFTLTRSIMAENSPYYETGLKLYVKDYKNFLISLFILNGWQNIQDNNSNKALGSQVQWKHKDKLTLNYSTFLGNEQPDSAKALYRTFHNLYAIYNLSPKSSIAGAFDIGWQQKESGSGWNQWTTASIQSQVKLAKKLRLGLRAEYYSDPKNVIIHPVTKDKFLVYGGSANLDYVISDHLYFRNEFRFLNSPEKIFINEKGDINNVSFVTSSVTFTY